MHAITSTPPDLVQHGLSRFRRLASVMFPERRISPREMLTRLAQTLAGIDEASLRQFAGVAARHIRAMLCELAATSDEERSDELLEWVAVHTRVDVLPEDDREVLDLLMYWGLSPAEVARLLGISQGGVNVRWREARLLLREG
jgi:DNA-directed RNA polymerase specialized sigma24 family protein